MAILQAGQDIVSDTEFFGFNANLNAGDRLTGIGANDTFFYAADDALGNLLGRTFAAFQLIGVENFDVVNDSLGFVAFDLSSSTGLRAVSVSNSSEDVDFLQIVNLVSLSVIDTTNAATVDVDLEYQDSVVAGANDAMSVTVNSTDTARIRIGRVGDDDNGIEIVNLTTVGDSVIGQLDTDLRDLNINGGGNVEIVTALNTSVRTITSTGSGNVDLSWVNNAVGVTYNGSMTGTGVNDLLAGNGNDIINTFEGNDIIDARGGNDTINAGNGDNTVRTGTGVNTVVTGTGVDRVFAQGSDDTISTFQGNDIIDITAGGRTTVNGGDGSDLVLGTGGSFNAAVGGDVLNMGADFDNLELDSGSNDVNFTNVTQLEGIAIRTAGTTNLGGGVGGQAQEAGINTIFLVSGGDEVVNATSYTDGLRIQSFGNNYFTDGAGNDTIRTGSGGDQFLVRGDNNLTDADILDAAAGFDSLNLEGDTTILNGQFSNFEFIALESSRFSITDPNALITGGNTYNIRLRDVNAASNNSTLFINGSALQADTDGGGGLTREDATINTQLVTLYDTNIILGNGDDLVESGARGDTISTNGGSDQVSAGGGNDIIDTGDGQNFVALNSGNNTLTDTGNGSQIYLGTGNDRLLLGGGDQLVVSGSGVNFFINSVVQTGGDLNINDSLTDGGGRDTIALFQRNYVDADFTNVSGFEVLDIGFGIDATGRTVLLDAEAQQAGFDTVIGSGGNDIIDAQGFTRALTFDLTRGGSDIAVGGSGDDVFIAGVGNQQVTGRGGADTLRVNGSELDIDDAFFGGAGNDTVELDNSGNTVNARVNLSLVTDVENYTFTSGGDLGAGVDANNNTLRFAVAPDGTITTQTFINISAVSLTDPDDTFFIAVDASVQDADFAFNVTGGSTTTTLSKENFGVNNDINFQGGTGSDTLVVSGGDLGSTTIFNGGGGTDVIRQVAGGVGLGQNLLSDDSYVGVDNVEILSADVGALNAVLGANAAASGLLAIVGNTGDDNVLLSSVYTGALTYILGNGGNDTFNAAASAAVMTFIAVDSELTAADTISGGTGAGDVMQITATGGVSNGTNVTGVETITYVNTNPVAANGSTLTIDTTLVEVNGGTQTINAGALDGNDVFTLNAGTATANLVVTGGGAADVINTGLGNDIVNGGLGSDRIFSGRGTDTVNGGDGDDVIFAGRDNDIVNGDAGNDVLAGDLGDDTINGGSGNDLIRGGDGANTDTGADTINGGSGNDQIDGGIGADIMDGGTGSDIFFYSQRTDSSIIEGKDIINNFESGVDKIDARGVLELSAIGGYTALATINFAGNFGTFGDAQSAITAGDNILDVVYQQDTNTLWFDLNDDGTLNGDDLQITVNTTGVADTLTGADVFAGSVAINTAPLAAFDALFI